MTVPGASRPAGTSHSSLSPIAYCAGSPPSGSARSSCLVRWPRTPSAKIVTLARMSAPGSTAPRGAPFLPMPAIAGADAGHARALEQHLLAGEPHEQIDPGGLDLPGQPLDELAERDDVVAVIAERRRRDRQPELAAGRQVVDAVGADLAGQRRALGDEVGDQFGQRGRIEQGPGQGVGTGLPGLLHHGDRQRLAAVGGLQLGKTQRRRQAGRPGPDDQHVNVEGFSFHALAPRAAAASQPLPSSAMSAGAISNRSPWMP